MSYYEILGLNKEPFSTSPDPAFFYRSSAHSTAIQRLEIAIRLKRGLSVILGDVGIGKTTMSRALLQNFANDDDYIFHIILDPTYKSEFQFLTSLSKMFGIKPDTRSTLDYKEELEKYLFRKGVDENKTVVLLIDEGQKLSTPFLEILRTLLNYETNEYKLLQLVLVSQMELLPRIKKVKNFFDRIALKYIINPLDQEETKELIEFRLVEAGSDPTRKVFTDEAVERIYEYAQGYPRKTSIICHNALEALVMHQKSIVDSALISKIIDRESI
ncbi:MAG: AAA family ATPase [Candidatus Omnitrophica bacterium]|nr:AAA family ATPase [Candidatus Omnitrophota bacterium]